MELVTENLQMLSHAILKKAQTDAQQVLTEAQANAGAIQQRARQQAEAEQKRILARAQQEAERIRSQSLATAQLKARTLKLERREALLDEVFDAVRQRLSTVSGWTDYNQVVVQLAREAIAQLRSESCSLRADAQAQDILANQELSQLSETSSVRLQMGAPLEQGTGVIAETLDGFRQYDNTLEARLEHSQESLRFSVYRILMGESL
ncbi:MAG: hypothetical protein JXA33_10060 [Anaerolineae bacterium]|nr:hypothetical protein [Anaerolineae bacterium]